MQLIVRLKARGLLGTAANAKTEGSRLAGGLQLKVRLKVGQLIIVQELCESRGGRPGLSVLTSLLVSVDVKNY